MRFGPLVEVPEKATAMASTAMEADISASSQRTARLRSPAVAEADGMCVGFLPSAVAVIAWMVEVWAGTHSLLVGMAEAVFMGVSPPRAEVENLSQIFSTIC